MSDKLKEFVRQTMDEMLTKLPLEERFKGLSPDERPAGLSAQEVVAGLSPEARKAVAQQLKANGSSPQPQ